MRWATCSRHRRCGKFRATQGRQYGGGPDPCKARIRAAVFTEVRFLNSGARMAQPFGTASDAEQIQRQMRELRADLREDVQDVVVSAHKMADIGNYVRAYPWLCVGAALAAGYLVVPQRAVVLRPDAEALVELAKKHKLFVNTADSSTGGKVPRKRGGLFGELLGLAAATLLQGGLKVVT